VQSQATDNLEQPKVVERKLLEHAELNKKKECSKNLISAEPWSWHAARPWAANRVGFSDAALR
jgi:hypothetical protein